MGYTYNLKSLMKNSMCKIAFVNDYNTAIDLKAFFAEKNPQYITELNENLFSLSYRKIGPFKSKKRKSIFELLYSTDAVKDILHSDGVDCAVKYVKTELDKMDLSYYIDRSFFALSNLQRLRASYLYDIFDGESDFLLCDCACAREDKEKRIKEKKPYFTIAEYMRCSDQCKSEKYNLVWLTDLSVDEMLKLLGDSVKEKEYSFFSLNGNDIVELDKEKLLSDFTNVKEQDKKAVSKEDTVPATDAKTAFDEARNYDRYFRTVLPQYFGKDDLKKAFALYKSAAEIGHPGAQFALGELYCFGHEACTVDKEKALYWYIMAEFNKDYDKKISNDVIKEVHYLAPMRIKDLVLQVPNGKDLLRKYAGNQAERLIEEAESKMKIEKLFDGIPPIDQEDFNKEMKKSLDRLKKF